MDKSKVTSWQSLEVAAKEEILHEAPEGVEWVGWVVFDEQLEKYLQTMEDAEDEELLSSWHNDPHEAMALSMADAAMVISSGMLCTDHTFLLLAKVRRGEYAAFLRIEKLNLLV